MSDGGRVGSEGVLEMEYWERQNSSTRWMGIGCSLSREVWALKRTCPCCCVEVLKGKTPASTP